MAAPIDLRNDFDSVSLRRLAKRTRDATQSCRLLALAEVYDGGSRTDASRIGGVGLQIIRDWVLRFNARGADGLVDGKSPGAPSKLNADHRRALAEVVEAGPVPAVDGVVRWRRKDLARWLLETFTISLDETTVGRELKALGFAKISARPRHYAQNELAVEAFKKNFPAELAKIRARLPKGVEIELWWQDEARIGQKNKLTRRWARRGTRPRAPRDQRTEWAYIFGAICPAKGKGAGLVMPWCDTDAMAAHLIEISAAVDPGAHAVLIVDQAGWHLTPKLAIPDNITVLALPPRSPELNPVENVWQFMRDNWLSNRIFKSYEDIVALCCQAWNNLIDQPWKIMSLGMRKWAHGFFNARGADGLVDGKSPGAPSKLNADHRRALAEVVEAGPVPAVDGVVRWRRKDLARWLLETFAISLDETTVGRELKALGFAKISARPRHYAQNELAVEAFKKNFPAELAKIRARLPKGVEIELWWQDEARIGQKNKLTRRWARRGTRPRAPRDQRTEWAYIFGAICPAKGKGAGLVMPWCDTDAMAAHLIEISAAVDPGAHAVLIVDQAGWHLTPKLAIPDNITVLALPPRAPRPS